MNLYEKIKATGAQTNNHFSDLYVENNEKVREILHAENVKYIYFCNQITGSLWIDIPFEYAPFWKVNKEHRNSITA